MRVVNYYPTARVGSGVTIALWSWARALAASGVPVAVLHAGNQAGAQQVIDDPAGAARDVDGIEECVIPHRGRGRASMRPVGLRWWLRRGDVLVLHEGWVLSNHVAALEARLVGVPYLVMPHGVYARAWRGYLRAPRRPREIAERYLLEHAGGIHLFFDSEAADVLDLAPAARCFAVPTGMPVPEVRWEGGGGYLSWVGRIDPYHKGLDLLVEAVAILPAEQRPRIIVSGYDYRGLASDLRSLVSSRGVGAWVELRDAIRGDEKCRFMRRADGCVHPSRWESYGLALMENLALGVPCLVSSGAHVASLLSDAQAAIVVRPTAEALAGGLVRLGAEGPCVAPRGRRFVQERLSWDLAVSAYLGAIAEVPTGS